MAHMRAILALVLLATGEPAAPPPNAAAFTEKLAFADRLFGAGDFRNALFAYREAVDLEPDDAGARVRLGRAYAALRHPARAQAQYEKALLIAPGFAEARRAMAELPPPGPARSPAQRYRAALDLMAKREYARAVTELDGAIAEDPRLAVAYVARASAQLGLARYREAADDYQAAIGLDPGMATPLYGLAECRRLLGGQDAAELYRRYAESRAPDVREDLRALAKKRAAEGGSL